MIKALLLIIERAKRPRPFALVILSVFGSFLDAVSVALVVPLLSAIMDPLFLDNNQYIRRFFDLLGITTPATRILIFCGSLIAFFILKTLYQLLVLYYQSNYYSTAIETLSTDLLSRYLRADFLFHISNNPADLIRNIKTEIPIIFLRILYGSINILTDIVMLVGILGVLLFIEPVITFAGIGVLGFVNLVFFRSIKANIKKYGKIRQEQEAETYKWISQSLGGIKELKVLDRISYFMGKSAHSYHQLKRTSVFSEVMGKSPKIFIEGIAFALLVALIMLLLLSGGENASVLPKIAMFAAALFKIMPSVNRLMGESMQIRFSKPALDVIVKAYNDVDINTTVDREPETMINEQSAITYDELAIRDLHYSYPGTNKDILRDFSLTIHKNESIGIIGSSGAGKTTLLNILLGLLRPTSGGIYMGGVDILANTKLWKLMIGFVPQDIFLLDDSIRANVAYGINAEMIDDVLVWKALEMAQLDSLVRELDAGLDAQVGDRGLRLSGGQRQRIGIARALFCNPEVLIFDEATSSLDNETEADITKAINSLMGKKTIIIVAHRLSTLKKCDRIIKLHSGRPEVVENV